ncbi:MAG TPA: PAS domain S-box protein [Candidatus Dormibacteraeota bacterium]|nr:PAS domain S-box protein [Candidatus Dormibacteraeota bacterium]
MSASPAAAADPLFGAAWATVGIPRPSRRWSLPLINAIASVAILAGAVYRIWEANLPADTLRSELVLIFLGAVLAVIAIGIRMSRYATSLFAQIPILVTALVLGGLVLSVAGRWLGNDLAPLAVVVAVVVILQFDVGLRSRRFGYVFGIAIAGLAAMWIYAVTQLTVPVGEIIVWTMFLIGMGLLAFLTSRTIQRDAAVQVDRQSSLLATLSDLGEGILITEDGRFVAGNDAYIALTGYTREELAALPSLIDLAPQEDRARFRSSLATRLSGGNAPHRYTSAILTKAGERVDVEVAVHNVTSRRGQTFTLVSDITERRRAEHAEREMETRFRTLFEQAQAGMAFTTLDGHITTVNPAFCDLVGYSDDELRTLSLLDITHPDDAVTLHDAMQSMLLGDEEGRRIEKRYTRKNGEHVWVDLTMRLVRDDENRPVYFQTVAVDIRDRKRAEVLQAARFAVTQALVTSPGWDKAATGVLEGLCRSLDWELAEYWEVDVARETMRFSTLWKRPGRDTSLYEATASQVTYRRGEGLAGRVWESGAPVSMPDLVDDNPVRSAAAIAVGLHGVVGFPVRSGRRVVGMISLHTWAPRDLDDGLVAVMNDVGSQIGEFVERKRAEVALQESEKRMRSVLDNVSDGLATIDQNGVIDSANPAVTRLFGYGEQDLVGQQADILIATTHRTAFDNYLERRLKIDGQVGGAHETMGKRKNGSLFPLEFVVSSMQVGTRHLFIATLRDISERKAQTDALEYQALHDALTGLPNRSLFGDRLRQALLAARRNQKMFGVLLLDLDRFKDINDALGHDRGDSLLQEVTARLRGCLRATDTIARLGGDEFAVLTTDAKHPEDVVGTARKVLASLEGPFAIADQMVETGASIGIAMYPIHGDDPGTLLRRADVAMYVAKRSGGGYAMYQPEQEAQTMRRSGLAGELRRSIPQGELVLHYQPQVTLATGAINCVEALVRWNHPREGLMPPDRFIPMAEETGIIHPLTAWVIDSALEQLCRWLDEGLDISISLNVSPRNIEDHSLEEMVARALGNFKVDPSRLTLEITEGVAMAAAAAKALHRLHEIGVRLALDDFGTGYSSLLYLMRLPVNEIKIDRSFVSALATDPDSGAIVRSAVGLGHNLGLRVVAEGLQDRMAEAVLVEAHCDAAQGFLVGRPAEGNEMTAQLHQHVNGASSPEANQELTGSI